MTVRKKVLGKQKDNLQPDRLHRLTGIVLFMFFTSYMLIMQSSRSSIARKFEIILLLSKGPHLNAWILCLSQILL